MEQALGALRSSEPWRELFHGCRRACRALGSASADVPVLCAALGIQRIWDQLIPRVSACFG